MAFITLVPVAPLRQQASHRSEMVSQLLFGELCEYLEASGDFFKVRCQYDGYEGWVQASQVVELSAGLFDVAQVFTPKSQAHVFVNNVQLVLSPGSDLYFSATGKNHINFKELNIGQHVIRYEQVNAEKYFLQANASAVIELAKQFLGTSYLWGGKSIWGIDCSGLVQMSFKMAGMFIPRDAWQQAEGGDVVGFLQEAKPGDLAFFDNAEGRITHVGILLNDHEIIHASGVVRIDPIDNFGIINRQSGKRTHTLRIIKRFF